MINRKQLFNDIERQLNLQESIPAAMNLMSSDYYAYSALQFTMNFYNYYEMICEGKLPEVDHKYQMLVSLVKETLLSSFDGQVREEAIRKIDAIRTELLQVMQKLTASADQLNIYEYILNRVEKNYEEGLTDFDNDETTKQIMQSIFADEDQLLINARIRAMLSQLPVRMTKSRFFDMLKDSFSIYEGNDKASVEDFLYMVRSSAGLNALKGEELLSEGVKAKGENTESIELIESTIKELESMNMIMMSQQDYQKARDILTLAMEKVLVVTDRYFSLQEVVNAYYCMLLNQPYISMEVEKEVEPLFDIIRAIAEKEEGLDESLEDEIVDKFEATEGKLERYLMLLQKDEAILDIIKQSNTEIISSNILQPQFLVLQLSQNLTSNSAFIDLHEQKPVGKADKSYIEHVYNDLVQELITVLERNHKLYNRAVIAAVLGELPVLFESVQEVTDYVKNALAGCRDVAEKVASVELFWTACE